MKLFVLDPHTTYRRGLADVEQIGHAESVAAAREDPALAGTELVVLDPATDGDDLIAGAGERVLVCSSDMTNESVLATIQHDIVTKPKTRSRSQAVAFAVREGLI